MYSVVVSQIIYVYLYINIQWRTIICRKNISFHRSLFMFIIKLFSLIYFYFTNIFLHTYDVNNLREKYFILKFLTAEKMSHSNVCANYLLNAILDYLISQLSSRQLGEIRLTKQGEGKGKIVMTAAQMQHRQMWFLLVRRIESSSVTWRDNLSG